MTVDDRIAALESRLASQHEEIVELRSRLEATPADVAAPPSPPASSASAPAANTSRRKLLTGGAVAAGAAVVGATVAPRSAAAADGNSLIIGNTNTSGAGNTYLRGDGTTPYSNRNILTVSDQNNTSSFEAAIGGYGEGDRVFNGVYAYAGRRVDSDSTTGYAVVARNSGGRANLLLPAGGNNPRSDTYAHQRGAVRNSQNGDLWFCTSSGTPGTWRKLAGPQTSGALHAIAPARVYDSRFIDGPLPNGGSRLISVANRIDVNTGDIDFFNVVPDGATAIFFNVTLDQTTGLGFVLVSPGSATEVTGSTINWTGPGEVRANASLTTLDDARNVRVFAGGAGSTQFIIDVTGYTL